MKAYTDRYAVRLRALSPVLEGVAGLGGHHEGQVASRCDSKTWTWVSNESKFPKVNTPLATSIHSKPHQKRRGWFSSSLKFCIQFWGKWQTEINPEESYYDSGAWEPWKMSEHLRLIKTKNWDSGRPVSSHYIFEVLAWKGRIILFIACSSGGQSKDQCI